MKSLLRGARRRARRIKPRLTRRLLKWFRQHGRSFPWRRTTDPYRVLVAEMMLQRTQAVQVVEPYASFVRCAPTLQHAAKMPKRDLRAHFASLGLAKRGKLVGNTFGYLLDELDGSVPADYSALLGVPGVGDYTARAILLFAYGKTAALLDANIVRIYARLLGLDTRQRLRTHRGFRELAEELVPVTRAKDYHWALIDFGAAVCGRSPKCDNCVLADICLYASEDG